MAASLRSACRATTTTATAATAAATARPATGPARPARPAVCPRSPTAPTLAPRRPAGQPLLLHHRPARGAPTPPAATPPSWPQATENKFFPGHYAAVALAALKWAFAVCAVAAVIETPRFLAFTVAAGGAGAAWAPFVAKLLGSNYIMLAATAASLQQLHQSGLGTGPAGEALTLGLLAAAAFRGLHLALYRPAYTPSAWAVQAVGVGVVVALAAALYSAIAAASFEAEAGGGGGGGSPARSGLTTLAPKPGVPLSAAYAAAAVLFLGAGVVLGALPPAVPAAVFAGGGEPAALLAAMRGAFASGLVFPGAVAAWVLKDAADAGTLGWPSARALNVGLLAASATRAAAVFMAARAGVLSPSAPWPVPVAIHGALALVAAGGLVKGGWGAV